VVWNRDGVILSPQAKNLGYHGLMRQTTRFLVPVQTGERGNTRSETWVTPDAAC
jgi:GH15 family glucan-1,4-alpha-glucosidase